MTPLTAPPRLDADADVDAEFARIVDELTRRGFLAGGLASTALLGLAACGSGSSKDGSSSSAPTTRTVQGAYGPVDVPANPKRVVALSKAAIATLLDVGLTPIGVDDGEANVALPQYKKTVQSIATVGSYGEFDVEKIVALKPDLLISYDTYIDKKLYDKVKSLVPTFALKTNNGNVAWQDATAGFADAVNRNSQLAVRKQKYSDLLAQIKTTYHDQLAGNRWEVIQQNGAGSFYRYQPSADSVQLLTQLGATIGNASGTNPNYWGDPISYESITAQLGKATVILGVQIGIENAGSGAVTSNELFKRLPAAVAGHVYLTNDLFLSSYSGGIALLDFITDVCKKLAAK